MKLTFQGKFDNVAAANVTVHPKLPHYIEYAGYIEHDEHGDEQCHMAIGDYILVDWEPSGIAKFNKYGKYDNGNPVDNLRAEDLTEEFFIHAVGYSLKPRAVENLDDAERDEWDQRELESKIPEQWDHWQEENPEVVWGAVKNFGLSDSVEQSYDCCKMLRDLLDALPLCMDDEDAERAIRIEVWGSRCRRAVTDGNWTLVRQGSNIPVVVGDKAITSHNDKEPVRVCGGNAPHKASSSGRVRVAGNQKGFHKSEYFPHVYGFKWTVTSLLKTI